MCGVIACVFGRRCSGSDTCSGFVKAVQEKIELSPKFQAAYLRRRACASGVSGGPRVFTAGMWKTRRGRFLSFHDACMTGWGHNKRCAMPWYYFTTKWPDGRSGNAASTSLSDDDHACRYARLLIREFSARPGYNDPGLKLIVQNECGEMIADIAFSAHIYRRTMESDNAPIVR